MKRKCIYLIYIVIIVFLLIVCLNYDTYVKKVAFLEQHITNNYEILIPTLVLSIFVASVGACAIYKKRQPDKTKIDASQRLYGKNPLEMKYIYDGYFPKNQFYITFLNLVKKGILKVSKEIDINSRKTNYYISIQEEKEPLEKYELFALDIFKRWIKEDKENQFKIERNELLKIIKKDKEVNELNKKYEEEIKKVVYKKYRKEEHLYDDVKKLAIISMFIIITVISIIVTFLMKNILLGTLAFLHLSVISILFTMLISTTRHNESVTMTFSILAIIYMLIITQYLAKVNCQILMLPFVLMFINLQYTINLRSLSKEMVDQRERIRLHVDYIQDISITKKHTKEKVNWEDSLITAECFGIRDMYLVTFDNSKESNSNLAKSIKAVGNTYYEFKQEFEEVFKYIEE